MIAVQPNSGALVLHIGIAPAARSRATCVESAVATLSLNTWQPYDVISFDTYGASSNVYGRLAVFRQQGLDDGKPYWCYLNAYYDSGQNWLATESDMRWNVYSHALYGYTGFSWFIYQMTAPQNSDALHTSLFQQTGTFDSATTARFDIAAQLNSELINLQRAISQLTSTDVRYLAFNSLGQPSGTTAWSAGAGADPFITAITPDGGLAEVLVGFFRDEHDDGYVMVQNVHHENGSFPVGNSDSQTIRVDFDFSGADTCHDTSRLRRLDRSSGAVVDMVVVDHGDGTAHVDLELAAGDAVLFKYANEVPFALASW